MVAGLCACNQDDKGCLGNMTPLRSARLCLRLPVQPEHGLNHFLCGDFSVVPGSARNPGFEIKT